MMDVTELFCKVDDFYQVFEEEHKKQLIKFGQKRDRKSAYRHFKGFYTGYVEKHLRKDFPGLLSYSRFIQLMPRILVPFFAYLSTMKGRVTGISFIDSTSLTVCNNKRINRNKVFEGLASRGKTSMGWFYGFKLHLIVNEYGEQVKGKLFGDKGYISSSLSRDLFEAGTQLITTARKNIKNRLMPLLDRMLLPKRFIIETINDPLKNISHIEHTRHRSFDQFSAQYYCGINRISAPRKKAFFEW